MAMTQYTVGLAALNLLLLVSLLYVYLQNYRQLKSPFVLGLIVFAAFLLIENALALYFSITMMGLYAENVAFQALILRAIETIALTVLTYVTWRS